MTTVPQPLQIISIGDSEESCLFRLNEENLAQIIDKIPPNTKVGIVAVVGAFRTGKSFLLNLFLRFLRNGKSDDESQAWLLSEGEELLEGNMNEGGWSIINSSKEEEAAPLQRQKSFAWRGGQQRQTTGIWMWSEPFIRATDSTNGEKIAILLMDTQGMFDNETTMTLTAQIFGLSTLVSSFQIYNVDKRIQEDNLQHLALFSEYGRMALLPQAEKTKPSLLKKTAVETALEKSQGDVNEGEGKKESEDNTEVAAAVEEKKDSLDNVNSEETHDEEDTTKSAHLRKPFQRLQFLVRDWQNFDTEYSEGASQEVFDKVLEEMQTYLQGVLRPRNASDLQSTRDQILRCFEKLDCFLLPHPGFEVTKKNFDGSINRISPDFRALLNQYVRIIFNQELEAKHINQRAITGPELKNFFEVYVKMFQAGEKQFPKAMTMLEATAEANNRNAYDLAIKSYLDAMVALLGGKDNSDASTYVKETDFHQKHESFLQEALKQFDEIATMGSDDLIEQSRQKLLQQIEVERKRFHEVNALKNPYRDMEYYILPLLVAFVAYVSAKIVDRACSHDVCERIEDTFDNIYLFVFFMMIVMGWRQIRKIIMYVKELLPLVIGGQVVDIQSALHAAAASGGNKKTQ